MKGVLNQIKSEWYSHLLEKGFVVAIVLGAYIPNPLFAQDTRPNIIFILTDDQRWDALGYAGNEIIETPEMDRLASDGTYFKNAFVTTPICAASRATIITGLYERAHRYTFQQPPLDQKFVDKSYFVLLRDAGYFSGFLGKMGVNFADKSDTTLFDRYMLEHQSGYYRLTNGATEHAHLTDVISNNAIDFINEAPRDRPFCLSISYYAPHAVDQSPAQYVWPKDLDSLYSDTTIPGPIMSSDAEFEALPEKVKRGFNRVRWKWRYDSPEKYQQMVKGYYRMITGIDRNIGKIREALEANGQADNTVIIMMGDNGYFLGERQIAGKWLMYEPSLRVPLIIYNPARLEGQGKIVEDMALNVDIAPTMLDFAGVKVPEPYQGYSLAPYSIGEEPDKVRERFLCEHLWDFDPIPPSEGIRTSRYKYFRYIDDPSWEELYDLETDPNEAVNLVSNEDHQHVLSTLRSELVKLIQSTKK